MTQSELLDDGSVLVKINSSYNVTITADVFKTLMTAEVYSKMETSNVVLLVLYVLVFLLAAVSNVLVIVVICRFQHLRRFASHTILLYYIST